MQSNERPVEELPEAECLHLLAGAAVGRIAVVDDGQPLIFPVNFVVDGRTVAFRTAPGTKLARAPMSKVAFEVDGLDETRQLAWSVMVQGTAYDVTATADAASARLRDLAVRPMAPGERHHWLGIWPTSITGRRFPLGAG